MQWNEWPLLLNDPDIKHSLGDLSPDSLYELICKSDVNTDPFYCFEYLWYRAKRPYYSVYPIAVDALKRVKLDIQSSSLHLPLPQLLIRFPLGQEPVISDGRKLRSIICAEYKSQTINWPSGFRLDVVANKPDRLLGIWSDYGEKSKEGYPLRSFLKIGLDDLTLEEAIKDGIAQPLNEAYEAPELVEANELPLRIVAGISLLADDPDLISRDVLSKDTSAYLWAEKKGDLVSKTNIEERASRRGKLGWIVGENWEKVPGFRRRHLAIRHTGPGRTIPKLVTVKECIVHRNILSNVPTGELG